MTFLVKNTQKKKSGLILSGKENLNAEWGQTLKMPCPPHKMNYPKVSIVIATYNRCNALKNCLESILSQSYPKESLELLILDDASTDNTKKEIPEFLGQMEKKGIGKVSFFRNEQNTGIAGSRQILGKKASTDSEFILFLDDDAYLTTKCLEQLIEYITVHTDAGVISPRVVLTNNPEKTAHKANFVGKWTARYYDKDGQEPIVCDWVDPVCMLARYTAVEETGGFWPGFYRSHEGTDFCLMVKKLGYKVVYYPIALATHSVVFNRHKKERLYYLYRNKIILIYRNFPFPNKIFAIFLMVIFGLPKYLIDSVKFHKGLVFSELKLIFQSVFDGFLGVTGPGRAGK